MRKEYELWLDESGQFIDENKLKHQKKKPSLVGGFLVEKSIAERIPYDELIDNKRNHAMELTGQDKKEYILPVLERMKDDFGARQIYFENAEYVDESTGRQLYLRVLAEGLLQLMQQLNAQSESVELSVIIAQRQDVEAEKKNRRILSVEYQNTLKMLMEKKRREHRIFLHEDSKLVFQVKMAHLEHKLQLADFVCNSRLTRDSKAFADVRDRLDRLHKDAYRFTLSEISSANYIKRSLADGSISDAIMELCTTKDKVNHQEMMDLIIERIKITDYRLVKSQMKQSIADITAFAAKEDDYEIGEAFLKRIMSELVGRLKKEKQPYLDLYFAVLLQLTDMYLREGDVLAAEKSLNRAREIQLDMGNSLENVFSYYQLLEKEALLAIDGFDFQRGCDLMEKASGIFINLMRYLQQDDVLKERFPEMKSEYFGDALCMQLYAMMFVQRSQPELYEKMCELSDLALEQYPNSEGELERHRQYRSHIELEHGDYESALLWLYKAKCFYAKKVSESTMVEFLDLVCDTESTVSIRYYLMYYLLILSECKIHNNPQAEVMYQALQKQRKILEVGQIRNAEIDKEMQEVDMSIAQPDSAKVLYHPQEIIYWKYATYLNLKGYELLALKYYEKAVKICFLYEEYLTMQITGLGIEAERISCLVKMKRTTEAQNAYKNLKTKIHTLRQQKLPEGTERFLKEVEEALKPDYETMWKVSRKITY